MSKRLLFTSNFLLICALLTASLYFQFFEGMVPCPLCTLQRLSFLSLGIFFSFGIVFAAKRFASTLIAIFCILFSLLGIFLSGRQIWLQHLPHNLNTECGVSLQYMLKVLSFNEVFQKIFNGSAECSQDGFSFLSLNMAEWSLIWFVVFLISSVYLIRKKK
jgi:protein dithiol:quinone oxidoreductase